jgi:hypothetical protein
MIKNDLFPLGNWFINNYNNYKRGDAVLSASRAGYSLRKNVLLNRYADKIEETASKLVKPTIGTALHKDVLLDLKISFPDLHIEELFECDLFYGTPDIYLEYGDCTRDILGLEKHTLIDLKTVNVGTWMYNNNDFHHYKYQLHALKYLLEYNNLPVEHMYLWFLFTDWTEYKKEKSSDTPNPMELYKVEYDPSIDIPAIVDEINSCVDIPDNSLPPCGTHDTWVNPPFKVYSFTKAGKIRSRAMNGGSFHTREEAEAFSARQNEKTVVKYVKALDAPGCRSCNVNRWCNIYASQKQETR